MQPGRYSWHSPYGRVLVYGVPAADCPQISAQQPFLGKCCVNCASARTPFTQLAPKTIYLIRHGQTEQNRTGIIQGSGIDSELNQTGREQAQAFFERYHKIPFSKVYTSALRRTHQSVQGFIDQGIPWEQYAGLNEISWGQSEGKKSTLHGDAAFYRVLRLWSLGEVHTAVPGGESPTQVAERQQPVLDLIFSRTDEETILVCMHGRAIRILLCTLTGTPMHLMDTFEHRNLCLYKLRFHGHGHCTIEMANSVAGEDS